MVAVAVQHGGVAALPAGSPSTSPASTVTTPVPHHVVRHHPVRPYRVWCPLDGCCRYVAWDRGVRGDTSGIDQHLVDEHRADPERIVDYEDPARYKCLDCKTACPSYARFIVHGKSQHCIKKNRIGDKPYKCELCPGYVAFSTAELIHHLMGKHVRRPFEGVEPRDHSEAVEENRRIRPLRTMLYNDFGKPWLPHLN